MLGPDGKTRRDEDGKYLKKKIPMCNGKFADGTMQEFYERGYDMSRKKAQCGKSFANCPEGVTDCCC
ncbi:hypothetical protein B0H34DRAFT_736236 [Crassisporium funariophilum]|nr:hypothetical protein B0H34DRAFT_736236 [Crassisporium funariophilum]